jgi:hypothetical protein
MMAVRRARCLGAFQACAYPMEVGVDAMWRAVRRVRLARPIFVSLMAVGKGVHPRDAAVSLIVGGFVETTVWQNANSRNARKWRRVEAIAADMVADAAASSETARSTT